VNGVDVERSRRPLYGREKAAMSEPVTKAADRLIGYRTPARWDSGSDDGIKLDFSDRVPDASDFGRCPNRELATLEVSTAVKTRCCPVLETMTRFTEIAFKSRRTAKLPVETLVTTTLGSRHA
jgi:hypothetical protein